MILARLKKSLNIKYFMVGYLGLLTLFASLYFKDIMMFADGVLIVLLYASFDLLWTYARDRVWYLPVSSWISGFILTIGALPKPPLIILIALPLLAVASKQLLHFRKNRHVFNPASFALAVMSFFTPSVSWWAVTGEVVPTIGGLQKLDIGMWLFVFSAVAAVIILWRQNRWHVTVPFLLSYAFFLGILSLINGVTPERLPDVLFVQIVSSVILYFSTVMLIEPLTSTFRTRRQEIFYGAFVGFAIVLVTYLARKFNLVTLDPLVFGLLAGNLVASLLFLPNRKKVSTCANCDCGAKNPTIAGEASYWFRSVPDKPRYPALQGDKQVDVVIVGGGMAGISAAYFLSKNGISTALLESVTIASGDSGFTTACGTRFLDSLDPTLAAWESSDAAIALFKKTIIEEKIDCEWQEVDTACFTLQKDKKSLKHFAETFQKFQAKDSSMEYLLKEEASAAIGVPVVAAYRKKASEVMFHMRQFLISLAERSTKNGAIFFEDSEVVDIALSDQVVVKTKSGSVKAKWLIMATGLPPVKFFPKVAELLRSAVSYVIDIKFDKKPTFAEGFFWDDQDPYHYFRAVGEDEFILGGEDWKTNTPKPDTNPHVELEKWFRSLVGSKTPLKVINSWQGSLFYTPDTLPLIGPHPAYGKNAIFLTGWAGNGTAQGFFAGNIAADLVQQKNNPHHAFFACDRPLVWPVEAGSQSASGAGDISGLADNKGMVLDVGGKKLAVVKKEGKVKAFSTVCPHLGCQIEWNDGENTWDCPCHGSRFEFDGSLKNGPAKRGLDPVEISTDNDTVKLA
ncbi:MAG: Rieske family iron-sulfur cluster-binding protein [Parcubacteria group bacterium Gr01-1014_13]|nr:MAG: Rieske family iron-sulfur cluster-binding protein [Parcubacteria group bacterium Gr01-1014_13]